MHKRKNNLSIVGKNWRDSKANNYRLVQLRAEYLFNKKSVAFKIICTEVNITQKNHTVSANYG